MTVCGLVRLDGTEARRSTLTAMLAASVDGLPAARAVHLDGPFGVVTASASPTRSMPGVVVERDGLVVVVDGDVGGDADESEADIDVESEAGALASDSGTGSDTDSDVVGGSGGSGGAGSRDSVRRLAADFRVRGERSLAVAGVVRITLVWQPDRRRLVVSRDGWAASELLTWSDGQIFAFGTEAAHLVAAGLPRVATVGSIGRQSPAHRLASVHRLAPGDRVTVNVTAVRPRRGRRALRLVRPLGESAG